MYNWSDIVTEWNTVMNMRCKPKDLQKYKEGTVIDEEKSVRWNREEVERRNAAYAEEVATLNTKRNKARDTLYEKIYVYIMDEVGSKCTREKAKAIWDLAYENGHSYGINECKIYMDELIDLATILVE